MADPRTLEERALRILLRTSQHLRCEPEALARRLDEGRLWFVFDLVGEARRSLVRALSPSGEVPPDGVAVEDALRDLNRAMRVVRGSEPAE